MYGIAKDGVVLCDPIDYDKARFAGMVARLGGLADELPDSQPRGALQCGELAVLPGSTVFPPPPGDHIYSPTLGPWRVEGERIQREISWNLMAIEQAKLALLEALANSRWQLETGGVTLDDGSEVLTDTSNQARLSATYGRLVNGSLTETPWKFANGWRWVTTEGLRPVEQAVAAHVDACFRAEMEVAELINSATIDNIQALDVSTEFNLRFSQQATTPQPA